MRVTTWRTAGLCLLAATVLAGCTGISPSEFTTEDRLDRGIVILLPGIEGEGPASYAVRRGLADGRVDVALPIYRWGVPVPLAGLVWNQVDSSRARRVAGDVAEEIVAYRKRYPGRPVHLVGHSGGGAIAVFTAEQLPPDQPIDGIVLLSPSLSSEYDLSLALSRTHKGIVHFWSPDDISLLVVGTTIFGNLDGVHGPAAGARSFTATDGLAGLSSKLHQVRWHEQMAAAGHNGGHMGPTKSPFVSEWVAPWILAERWGVALGAPTPPSGIELSGRDLPPDTPSLW